MDYGNRSHVDLDLLMEIPCQFLELPFQVRQTGPGGVGLHAGRIPEARWDPRAGRRVLSHLPNLVSAFFPKVFAIDIFANTIFGVS